MCELSVELYPIGLDLGIKYSGEEEKNSRTDSMNYRLPTLKFTFYVQSSNAPLWYLPVLTVRSSLFALIHLDYI